MVPPPRRDSSCLPITCWRAARRIAQRIAEAAARTAEMRRLAFAVAAAAGPQRLVAAGSTGALPW